MRTSEVDEVLDADRLGNSLSQLFQMDGWIKLGGRIRLRVNGILPYSERATPPSYLVCSN
ncbi:hypothetical protein V8C37DRAFT_391339 [Trichoderma ceciliae]